jgi:23S rRNA (uracil1939-C5)-methyltransferase
MRYEAQLAYKKAHVEECLTHLAGVEGAIIHDAIPSERTFAYRNKMEFSFSDRRWFPPAEFEQKGDRKGFALGLHVPGTFHKVIDINRCLLQEDAGNQILREVKEYVANSPLPVYGLKSHRGFWRFLAIRYSAAFDEWMVNIVTSAERVGAVKPLADQLRKRMENLKAVVNNIQSRRASIAIGQRETLLAGEQVLKDKIGPHLFYISANSFFQTNTLAARRLYESISEYAELEKQDRVLDLYCGTGTIPIFIANRVQEVTGIEISQGAVNDAERNCRENGICNCRFIQGDILEKLSVVSKKPDVVIIDPPRAGMHKEVLAQVVDMGPRRVVYVSCNPATMARDLGVMQRHYELVEIQPVDMFPHTFHTESVAKLRLRNSRGKAATLV